MHSSVKTRFGGTRLVAAWRWLAIPVGDWRFWAIQLLILLIDAGHAALEEAQVIVASSPWYVPFTSLILIPLVYSALTFGVRGAVLTSLWVLVLSLPDMIEIHSWSSREGTAAVLLIEVFLTVLIAARVDRERAVLSRLRSANDRLETYVRLATEAQEEERKRLSRELHDDTLQALVIARGQLSAAVAAQDQHVADLRLNDVQRILADTTDSVRRFSRDLRPSLLDDLGMTDAIDWLVGDMQSRVTMDVRLQITGDQRRLDDRLELLVFRVVQEALRNCERHSGATEACVTLAFSPSSLVVTVRDNGHGFVLPEAASGELGTDRSTGFADGSRVPPQLPPSPKRLREPTPGGGLGLRGIAERTRLLGATHSVQSDRHGTRIVVRIPL